MRNKLVFLIIILSVLNVLLFSEDTGIYYRVIRDTPYFTTGYSKEMTNETADGFLVSGDRVRLSEFPSYKTGSFGFLWVNSIDQGVGRYFIDDIEVKIVANDLMPWDAEVLLDQHILSKLEDPNSRYYLMDYTAAVLKSQNRDTLLEYEPFWKNSENPILVDEFFDLTPWYQEYPKYSKLLITNCHIDFFVQEMVLVNIQSADNGYRVTVKTTTDRWKKGYPVPFDFTPVENDVFFDILLIFDGDYLDIILAKNNAKLATVIAVNKEFIYQYRNLMDYNTCDLSNITWPRHADGSCDYEVTEERRQEKNLMYRTVDNLRLRSAEETTSDILTTLEKGTIVTVLSLGKEDTIDGMQSNWVKVQLEDGTTGWCFGGYLSTTPIEVTSSYKSNQPKGSNQNKDSTTTASAGVTTSTLIVGGGVLVLLLGAGIFLLLKRKK